MLVGAVAVTIPGQAGLLPWGSVDRPGNTFIQSSTARSPSPSGDFEPILWSLSTQHMSRLVVGILAPIFSSLRNKKTKAIELLTLPLASVYVSNQNRSTTYFYMMLLINMRSRIGPQS